MNYDTVALLPMKANSQRIPGKNFKNLAGKPLFMWILETLLSIKKIDLIVINTDAKTMLHEKEIPETDRILIRERKSSLKGDTVSMNRIIEDDLENIEARTFLMTHTTNPFLSSSTIINALESYESDNKSDSLFTVNKFQTRFYKKDCSPINHDPANLVPTQDLTPWYEENSCLYIFNKTSFRKTQARIGVNPKMFITPRLESVDIDEQGDWELASAISLLNNTF